MTANINTKQYLANPIFHLVGDVADALGQDTYVVGGFVRDKLLGRHSNDLDFVTIGSGIDVAKAVAAKIGNKKSTLAVFKTYGTAQVKTRGMELEFVGARKESYSKDSRNPVVENGTLDDDQKRRDFTINAMAISVNASSFGTLLDPFNGIDDLQAKIIRTPLDPDVTFSDDPLRMMRAVRFATQLNFKIYPDTLEAIKRNCNRIKIITKERIADELMKIVKSKQPSIGFFLLKECGLLPLIFPELDALSGTDVVNGRGHKDNFKHTMQVLDSVALKSDNVWLRWAAIFHDIGKPATKKWDNAAGWTFHNHNFIGEKMVPRIFTKMRLPLNEHMKYVKKLVGLHMRPIALVEDVVTDSAVRRLLFDAGDDIDDLMTLCNADITSKNQEKVKRFHDNFELVKQKLVAIEEKDKIRNFQPPIDGLEIMKTFNLPPSAAVGKIKDAIKDAILDGKITNTYEQAYTFMLTTARECGFAPTYDGLLCYTSIDSPIGTLGLAAAPSGISMVEFGLDSNKVNMLAKKLKLTPSTAPCPLLDHCAAQLHDYFAGKLIHFSLPIVIVGTDFQKKTWQALRTIPYGTTISYKREAELAGSPQAFRAVGMANNANQVCIVIPCHRVTNADGSLGGFGGGIEVKKQLLALEKATLASRSELKQATNKD